MEKKIFVFDDVCNGCRNCQYWCAFANKQEFNRAYSRINVLTDLDCRYDTPIINCTGEKCNIRNEKGEPICVEMCPTGCLVYTDEKDASLKREELYKSREAQPLFKLIAPWKWPYTWKPWPKKGGS